MNTTRTPNQCNVTGKEILGKRKDARRYLKAHGFRVGHKKVYWCIFCEWYHASKAERGNWSRG